MTLIKKIDKIKKLAVFANYTWDKSLDSFKRFNLIYGWNGSGKTALSRLFDSLASGKNDDFPDLEYQVTIGDQKYSHTDTITTKVRVFNTDYVEGNVSVVDGHANPIYVLGEKSQEVLNQVEQDEAVLNGAPGDESNPGKIELRRRAKDEQTQLTKKIDKTFTNIAATISAAWSAAGAIRTYRRPDAKKRFDALTGKAVLSEEEMERCALTLSESAEPALQALTNPSIAYDGKAHDFNDVFTHLQERSKKLLAAHVENVPIKRLTEHEDLSKWVEDGVALHATHSSTHCEFCQQSLPKERLQALAGHFSEADRQLKKDIDTLLQVISRTKAAISSFNAYDEAKLYKDLRKPYAERIATFSSSKTTLVHALDDLAQQLGTKKSKTTEPVLCQKSLDSQPFHDGIAAMNEVLSQHNERSLNLKQVQDTARSKIEDHYLSTIYDDIYEKGEHLSQLAVEIDILDNGNSDVDGELGINELRERISANRAKVSSAHKSCDAINKRLVAFFGRDELAFEVETDSNGNAKGYQLLRSGEIAKKISEGEKTAIAFAHYLIQLTEQDFSLKEGVVVIDDPISSLDGALLYKVCAAIERQTINAGQLFIFTHNMEFFNHIKKWFMHDPQIKGQGENPVPCHRMLMIQNRYDASLGKRIALITDLDPMLRDHESEYHYLFKKLLDFDKDNPQEEGATLRAIYDYPNLARKLLECFLAYRIPTGGTFYVRTLALHRLNKAIATEDIKHVYNFVNSHSHLDTKSGLLQFNPTLAIGGQEMIQKTLGLIEAADPPHFKAMKKAVGA